MFQIVTPGDGLVLTQEHHMNRLFRGPQEDAVY